jgi:hypothetical protein
MASRYVLRRPGTAFAAVAYYPPGAIRRALWPTAEAAEAARDGLVDASAWTVMSEKEARTEDARLAKAIQDRAVREALLAAYAEVGERPFTETPGDLCVIPRLCDRDFIHMPVVVVRRIQDGPARGFIVKFPDNAVRHMPHDVPLDECGATEWWTCLHQWPDVERRLKEAKKGGAS